MSPSFRSPLGSAIPHLMDKKQKVMTPEQALVTYAQTQDPDAFGVLVRRYEQFVYSVCVRMLSPAEADDVVQDVFLSLMNHAEHIHGDLASWLHRCSMNACWDTIRSKRARYRRETRYASHMNSVREAANSSDVLAGIDVALSSLDESQRSLLIRYYVDGETQQSLANKHNVNQSTVKRRLDNALKELRAAMLSRGTSVGAGLLAVALSDLRSSAQIPSSVSRNLSKLSLAAPSKLRFDTASRFIIPLANSSPTAVFALAGFVCITGLLAWTLTGSTTPSLASTQNTPAVVTIPAQHFFVQEFTLRDGAAPQLLVRQTEQMLTRAGGVGAGSSVFLHPGGLGIQEERTLRVAIPVLDHRKIPGKWSHIEPTQRCLSIAGTYGDDWQSLISELAEWGRKNGHTRTFRDSFANLDPVTNDGNTFEIRLGISDDPRTATDVVEGTR